jgi:hypothetical protein
LRKIEEVCAVLACMGGLGCGLGGGVIELARRPTTACHHRYGNGDDGRSKAGFERGLKSSFIGSSAPRLRFPL